MDAVVATVEMLIRRPAQAVFNAFVEPRMLEQFWLKSASAPLVQGATVEWEFMVPGARETVTVTTLLPNEAIGFTWSDGIAVEMTFVPRDDGSTRLKITATGFEGGAAVANAVEATAGFTTVACDLKALLETGRSGDMVRDKALLIAEDMASD